MQRWISWTALICTPALAMVLLAGCGGGAAKKDADDDDGPSKPRAERKPKTKGGKGEELTQPTDGVIKGRVVLSGEAPKVAEIEAMATHTDKKTCLSPDATPEEKMAQTWILAPDKNGVANVVVKLVPPAGKSFKEMKAEKDQVEMDQPHCAFVPHVIAVAPGQTVLMKNSAPVPHNTKTAVDPASGNESKSETIPPGQSRTFSFNYQKKPITVACDFHPWMTGLIYVNDSPYIAVTDKDGNFEIKNVPTGVELTVVGIHEVGEVEGGKNGLKKTFTPGANTLELKVTPK